MDGLIGDNFPRRGNRFSRGIISWLYRLAGWRMEGAFPDLSHCVVIGAPHATYLGDFFLAMACIHGLGLDVKWMAKHTIFWFPLSVLLKWLGGIPVDRRSAHGVASQMADQLKTQDKFVLVLAPEGTRHNMDNWKSGFYYIAHAAGVPVVPVVADYARKRIVILPPYNTTPDKDADMAYLRGLYTEYKR